MTAETTNLLSAASIAGALADDDRRTVFAAVQLGARTVDAIVERSGRSGASVAKALGRLVDVGLIVATADGLAVSAEALQQAARDALHRPPDSEHADASADVRKVLDTFVVDGRLRSIPAPIAKRRIVLDWLAQQFEPGRRYTEAMVNLILGQRHPDTAALRRYLVDEEFLDREAGVYWRSGGSVPD